MTASAKTEIRDMFTRDLDAEIAELKARKARRSEAAQAHLAALDRVDELKREGEVAAVAVRETRNELVSLGVKGREIKALVAELRGDRAAEGGADVRATRDNAGAYVRASEEDGEDEGT